MFLFASEGEYDLLMSLEAKASLQVQKKAADERRLSKIAALQQQITELEKCRNQLAHEVSQLKSDSVSSFCSIFVNIHS